MKKLVYFVCLCFLLSIFATCYAENNSNLERVVVQTGWLINGGVAAVCVAIVNGYYEEEGLEIELRPGGPSGASFIDPTILIASDQSIDIAIDNAITGFVLAKAQDEPFKVKLIASLWQDNPMGFLIRSDSGLKSLKDLSNKKSDGSNYIIGATAGSVVLQPLAQYIGVPYEELNVIQTGTDASPFLSGQVDALFSFWTTQAYEAEIANIPWDFLPVSEIPGMQQPSLAILASELTIENKPEMLEKFLRATIRGIHFLLENPEEAAKAVLDNRCGGPLLDIEQETWIVNRSLPLFSFDNSHDNVLFLNESMIMKFAHTLYDFEVISKKLESEDLMDFSILNFIYR